MHHENVVVVEDETMVMHEDRSHAHAKGESMDETAKKRQRHNVILIEDDDNGSGPKDNTIVIDDDVGGARGEEPLEEPGSKRNRTQHDDTRVLEKEAFERSRAVAEQLQQQEFLRADATRATGFLDQDELLHEHRTAGPRQRIVMRGDQPLRMNTLARFKRAGVGGRQEVPLPDEVVLQLAAG